MQKNMRCLRCESKMNFIGTKQFQLGKATLFFVDLPHLLEGALMLDIYQCETCGKIEFFLQEKFEAEEEGQIAQKKCPSCQCLHDMDYPKCPYCGYDYRNA